MTRNWGIPTKDAERAVSEARRKHPFLTLFVSGVFGVVGASIAALGFSQAQTLGDGLFHGLSLIFAVLAAGFGCWAYIWIARPRFAAQLATPDAADGFSVLLRFYARAAASLLGIFLAGLALSVTAPVIFAILFLCISGGAGAAAAFQTVLVFVPHYDAS